MMVQGICSVILKTTLQISRVALSSNQGNLKEITTLPSPLTLGKSSPDVGGDS